MAFVRIKLVTDRKEQILTFWWPTVESFLRSHVGFNAFRSENFVCDMQKCDVFAVLRDVLLCVWHRLWGGPRKRVVRSFR